MTMWKICLNHLRMPIGLRDLRRRLMEKKDCNKIVRNKIVTNIVIHFSIIHGIMLISFMREENEYMARKSNSSGCGTIIAVLLVIGFISEYWPIILGITVAIAFVLISFRVYQNIKRKAYFNSELDEGISVNDEIDNDLELPDDISKKNNDGEQNDEKQIYSIDTMDGHSFEYFCAEILSSQGYEEVKVTRGSGDQGVDILAERDGIKYAIQCKRYAQPVGNKAVQEIYTGKNFYDCHVGIIMTNNYFTQSAKEVARKNGIILWDRDKLMERSQDSFLSKDENIIQNEQIQIQEQVCNTDLTVREAELKHTESQSLISYDIKSYQESVQNLTDNESLVIESATNDKREKGGRDMYDKEKGIYPQGYYLVGRDIPLGGYLVTAKAERTGSVELYAKYSDFKEDENSIIYENFTDDFFISLLEENTYLVVSNADIQKI